MSCSSQKPTTMVKNKTKDVSTGDGKFIISAPIVLKNFVDTKAKITNQKDYYIERSIQDYFIKFCESEVTREELETYLATKDGIIIKAATLEIEYRDGEWDSCNDDAKEQSRTGPYVIIYRIIKE